MNIPPADFYLVPTCPRCGAASSGAGALCATCAAARRDVLGSRTVSALRWLRLLRAASSAYSPFGWRRVRGRYYADRRPMLYR